MSPSSCKQSDGQLITMHLAGEDSAFSALVDRYASAIHRYAWRLTGNKSDAEDIAQETFLRLYEHIGTLHGDQPLKPWLFHVCTNLCRNLAKRKKMLTFSQLSSEGEDESSSSILENIPDTEPGPSESTGGALDADTIRKGIQRLPEKYRTVIILYYWEHLAYEEIATILSLPINTVRTRIKRAKEQLQDRLDYLHPSHHAHP